MEKKQAIAIIGAILLFLGVFTPIVSVPFFGALNYFHNGEGDGVIVLVLAAVTVPLALVKLYRGLWLTGGGSLAVLAFTFINFLSKMTELRSSMDKDLAGNPFAGLGQAVLGSVQLQWGWAVLIIGACLVIAAPFVREESTAAKVDPAQDAQGSATEPTPVPEETLPIDMEKLQAFARAPMPVPMPVALKPDKSLVRVGVVVGIVLLVLVGILAAFQFTNSPANIVDGPDYLKARSASQVHAPSAVSSPAPASLTGDRQAVKWTAMSHTAYAITGDVVTARDSISLLNKSYPLVLVRDLHGDELQNSAKLLDVEAVASSGLVGRLFRTSIPATARLLNGNSVCGDNAAWVVALVTHAEGTGSDAGDWLYLAFFSGDAEPLLQTQALENSTGLCATFNYQKAVPAVSTNQAAAQPPSDTPVTIDGGHESTVDNADVKTSKKLNAAGLRLLSATHPDFKEAKLTFEKAIQLDSSNIEALNNLGYVYSRIGDYRSAEAVLLRVLAVAPTRRAAHGNLGYVEANLAKRKRR